MTLYAIGIGRRKGEPVDTVLLEGLTTSQAVTSSRYAIQQRSRAAVAHLWTSSSRSPCWHSLPGRRSKRHSIKVRTKDRRLRVRARAGYMALPASTK